MFRLVVILALAALMAPGVSSAKEPQSNVSVAQCKKALGGSSSDNDLKALEDRSDIKDVKFDNSWYGTHYPNKAYIGLQWKQMRWNGKFRWTATFVGGLCARAEDGHIEDEVGHWPVGV